MNPSLIIARKRDGGLLSRDEIAWFIGGYAREEIPDYQMAALAMAIYFRGMSPAETAALTEEMLRSGTVLQWSSGRLKADKHSTGGVGDKTSLILAPLLACCGLQVPMISGRGLGTTGGTLDKLEAISGFRTDLSIRELRDLTERVGCVITGATADLAPADRKLYALRDVTATVPSVPLITASILSKKLAESLDALVLDVKHGSGAFMKSLDDARMLARSLVDTGKHLGLKTVALLTDMNQPLGRMAGNAVEVNEAVAVLEGGGPPDLIEVTLALGAELVVLAGIDAAAGAARIRLQAHIDSRLGLEKLREMVAAQGGNLDLQRPIAAASPVPAMRGGYITAIDAQQLGLAIIALGGGRKVITDRLDHSVGLEMLVRLGDRVESGQPLMRVFAHDGQADQVLPLLKHAVTIGDGPIAPPPLIVEKIE